MLKADDLDRQPLNLRALSKAIISSLLDIIVCRMCDYLETLAIFSDFQALHHPNSRGL